MRTLTHGTPAVGPDGAAPASGSTAHHVSNLADSPVELPDEFPPPDTARAREAAAAASAAEDPLETRGQRLRRNAHQGRLQLYALAVIAFLAVLVALAATNTARVNIHWLVGSSRVSLVWLVLAAAIIGWVLGVLASTRFQWLTRAPRRPRPKARG